MHQIRDGCVAKSAIAPLHGAASMPTLWNAMSKFTEKSYKILQNRLIFHIITSQLHRLGAKYNR